MTVVADPSLQSRRPAHTLLRRTVILGAVAATFGFVWLFGMFGLGRISEDVCLDDFTPWSGYGASTMSVQMWPPSIVCHLRGPDLPDRIVHHYGQGAFWAVWTVAAPPVMFAGLVVLGLAMRRYPPLPTATGSGLDRSGSET